MEQNKISSNDIQIHSKAVYDVINKYLRNKDNNNDKEIENNKNWVMDRQ